MVKARAETKAKLAEARAVEYFMKLMQVTRNIIWDVLPDAELLDVFEDRLRREVFVPARVEMPVREQPGKEELN